jgi:hypothetical protein
LEQKDVSLNRGVKPLFRLLSSTLCVVGPVLQTRTVLAGVKAFVVVLNRVLVAVIACAPKNFFLGHLTVADPSISHYFENRNLKT